MTDAPDIAELEFDERRYFSMIPNIIDEMELSPYAVRLYLRIKRRASDTGACFENTGNLAAGCRMSTGAVSKAKKELKKAGLIRIEKEGGPHGFYDFITVVDIWKKNIEYFNPEPDEQPSLGETLLSPGEGKRSQGETKNNPFKLERKNKKTKADAAAIPNGGLPKKPASPRRVKSAVDTAFDDEFAALRQHPAIQAIKKVTKYYPTKSREVYKHIITILGNEPDIERLEKAYGIQVGKGGNPRNVMYLMDLYKDGAYYSTHSTWADETYQQAG